MEKLSPLEKALGNAHQATLHHWAGLGRISPPSPSLRPLLSNNYFNAGPQPARRNMTLTFLSQKCRGLWEFHQSMFSMLCQVSTKFSSIKVPELGYKVSPLQILFLPALLASHVRQKWSFCIGPAIKTEANSDIIFLGTERRRAWFQLDEWLLVSLIRILFKCSPN